MEMIIANINLPIREDEEFGNSLERGHQSFGARNSAGKPADRQPRFLQRGKSQKPSRSNLKNSVFKNQKPWNQNLSNDPDLNEALIRIEKLQNEKEDLSKENQLNYCDSQQYQKEKKQLEIQLEEVNKHQAEVLKVKEE